MVQCGALCLEDKSKYCELLRFYISCHQFKLFPNSHQKKMLFILESAPKKFLMLLIGCVIDKLISCVRIFISRPLLEPQYLE